MCCSRAVVRSVEEVAGGSHLGEEEERRRSLTGHRKGGSRPGDKENMLIAAFADLR